MFRNKSAWFSNSVPQTCHNFWILEGGTVAGWRKADYLFSEDATCPDTLRIFESRDYLWNKVVVFHSQFLVTCQKRQSIKSVHIGHYVLPPASVQDEVRNMVGRFIWESECEPSVTQGSDKSFICQTEDDGDSSTSKSSDTHSEESEALHLQDDLGIKKLTGYVNMDSLPKYPGDLCDFYPKFFQCSICKAQCCFLNI